MLKRLVLGLILCTFYANANTLVQKDTTEYEIKPIRLGIVLGSIGAAYTTTYLFFLADGWWAQSEPFSFEPLHHDMHYASNLDKFGHFYTGVIFGELFTASFDWAGLSPFASTLCAGMAFGFTQVLVEFKDGLAPYGYSAWDATAGTLGGFYAMGKRFVPAMKYVDYKWAYWINSNKYWDEVEKSGGELMNGKFTGGEGVFVDDYVNQTHWLSFKVAKMLPDGITNYPEWLAFAIGIGIDETKYEQRYKKYIFEYYAALDYDLEAIFKPQKTWSKNLFMVLNHFKLPAPAYRFGHNSKFFLFFPLQFFGTVTF
jgi:hypothetical protein